MLFLLLLLTCCISVPLIVAQKSSVAIANWLTSIDLSTGSAIDILARLDDISAPITSQGSINTTEFDFLVKIDSSTKFQTITGYGAGLPHSSAFNLINLKNRNAELYGEVMKALFSTSSGAGLNILRFPLGSCDFSMSNTSYDEVDGDFSLSQFSIDPDTEYIIEVITDALSINSAITIIGSPWSAPSWLKVMDSLIGINNKNTLIDDDKIYNTYASYFIKTLSAFRQRGIHINYFTLQNEPLFGDGKDYPGMFLSSQQAFRLGQKVFEKLEKINRTDVQKTYIIGYDHNWDNYSYPIDLLNIQKQENAGKQEVFAGTAWHCYGGTMSEALDAMTAAYPNFEQHITECTGSYPDDTCDITRGMEGFGYNHEWDMQNLFLGAISHNAKSGTKWILALDENCGPVLSTVTYKNGRPFVSIPKYAMTSADIKYNQDYWTTSHMSRFFEAGSVRIGRSISSSKSSSANDLLLECVSKSTKTTCMIANLNHQSAYLLQVEDGSVSFSYNIPPWATAVLQWSSTI